MNIIRDLSELDLQGTYSYADYLQWQFGETLELIKGKISLMSLAPRRQHQRISFNLSRLLGNTLSNKTCQIYAAPFDVCLPDSSPTTDHKRIHTVVQPDLSVICDLTKLDDRGCLGAPDLVVEITSPATIKKDFNEKYGLYETAGVGEYWIVVPEGNFLHQYVLNPQARFELMGIFEKDDRIQSYLFDNLSFQLKEIVE